MLRKPERKHEELIYRESDAGTALDQEIEKHVATLLHRSPVPWTNPPRYTRDVDRARFLLDIAERREGARTAVVETPTGWACSFDFGGDDDELIVGRGETEALAICAAFMSRRPKIRVKRHRTGLSATALHAVGGAVRRTSRIRFFRTLRKKIRKLLFP